MAAYFLCSLRSLVAQTIILSFPQRHCVSAQEALFLAEFLFFNDGSRGREKGFALDLMDLAAGAGELNFKFAIFFGD